MHLDAHQWDECEDVQIMCGCADVRIDVKMCKWVDKSIAVMMRTCSVGCMAADSQILHWTNKQANPLIRLILVQNKKCSQRRNEENP